MVAVVCQLVQLEQKVYIVLYVMCLMMVDYIFQMMTVVIDVSESILPLYPHRAAFYSTFHSLDI